MRGAIVAVADARYEGRLELTWTNKHLRLFAHEDGAYEWVAPSDYRVAEVRLLHDAGSVGEVHPVSTRACDNLLVRGDALHALTSLIELPEFRRQYVGKVKLAYLDPPFNTQQSFLHYDDALEHSVWLTMMRDRLLGIKAMLAPSGSVWVHCDDSEQAYLKVMMDEVFTRECFIGTVIWEKVYSPRMDAKQLSSSHDYILVYSRQPEWRPNKFQIEPDLSQFPFKDANGRRYRVDTLRKWGKSSARADRPNLWYPIEHDGRVFWPIKPDGTEGNWRWGRDTYEQRKHEVDWLDRGHGLQPYLRQYAEESTSRPPETLWGWEDAGHNHEAKEEIKALLPGTPAFATPKPERLMHRIVHIASKPGDIVLDCFLGSGTTAAVAQKMGRRWVGIERSADTLATYTLPRLTRVVEGSDPGGITSAVGWTGGGSFRILDIAASMFDEDHGTVVLAEWATSTRLAEATAAQLGYAYEPELPFVGRKGRTRLAVIDGLVGSDVIHLLVTALGEQERAAVYGTAVDPSARDLLRAERPGSTLRKIPQSILDAYRRQRRQYVPEHEHEEEAGQSASAERQAAEAIEAVEAVTAVAVEGRGV